MATRAFSIRSISSKVLFLAGLFALSAARPAEPNLLSGLVWRNIGPSAAGAYPPSLA
jgi:hypothetical protein